MGKYSSDWEAARRAGIMPAMRRKVLVVGMVVMVVGATLAHPKPAWACSCVFPPAPADALSQWEAVFQGTVVSVAEARSWPFVDQIRNWLGLPYVYDYGSRLFSINVARSWKGVTITRVDVRTGHGGGDCGYGFVTGVEYVIYAGQTSDGNWGTNICSRTSPITSAIDDLTYLGPLPTLPLTPVPATFNWWWVCLGLFGIVLALSLIGLGLWRFRLKRARPINPASDI